MKLYGAMNMVKFLFDGLMIKNGCFEADLGVECGPIDIYCLSDTVAGERYKAEKSTEISKWK